MLRDNRREFSWKEFLICVVTSHATLCWILERYPATLQNRLFLLITFYIIWNSFYRHSAGLICFSKCKFVIWQIVFCLWLVLISSLSFLTSFNTIGTNLIYWCQHVVFPSLYGLPGFRIMIISDNFPTASTVIT